MKFVIALLLLGCILGQHQKCSALNNAQYGQRSTSDILFAREIVSKTGHWLSTVSGGYSYVQTPDRNGKTHQITQVKIIDWYTDNKGAIPSLKSGGPGSDFVNLHFVSKRSRGYKFTIEVYGRKDATLVKSRI